MTERVEHRSDGLTRRLAEYISGFSRSDVTLSSLRQAERAFVDTVGVATAASSDETVVRLLSALDAHAATGPSRSLVGSPSRQPAHMALINGTASHALDYDDNSEAIQGHPSAVLVPAALAVGEEVHATGREVLDAYLAGYHTEFLLATVLDGPKHYALGWHATSTLGVFGAAAAAAALYKLNSDQTAMALAIAGSMSSGSRRNFGTMTKPLHAGIAASHGVESAQLARAGFTGSDTLLETPLGFLSLFGDEVDLARADTVTVAPHAVGEHRLSVKKYPSCYSTHRAIDLALGCALSDVEAVERIELTVEPGGLQPVIHHRPTTGLAAKFSLEYTVATALLDGRVSLQSFEEDAVNRPAVQTLLRKVSAVESATPPVGAAEWEIGFTCAFITLRDGTVIKARCDQPTGHSTSPLSDSELHLKFVECMTYATGEPHKHLLSVLDNLRSLADISDLPQVAWPS